MTWFRRRRLPAAEALELELAGIVTDSSAAELRPVTDLLRAAARGLPPPNALRPRRRELMDLGASAAGVGQPIGGGGRLIRAPMIALAAVTIAVASVLGATTLVTSLLQLPPPPLSEPAGNPDPLAGSPEAASPHPRASQSEPPGFTDQGPMVLPDELTAELLATFQAACGDEARLPNLSGLDEAEARALVDALVTACEAVPGTPLPGTPLPVATPAVPPDALSAELLAELQAELQAACGDEARLPDLSGLDEAEARALVDALVTACEAVPGTLPP